MPGRKTHVIIGAGTGLAIDAILQYLRLPLRDDGSRDWSKFNWGEAIFAGGIGAVAGCLPDLLEPATDPNHRKFFHSVTCGGGAIKVAKELVVPQKISANDSAVGVNSESRMQPQENKTEQADKAKNAPKGDVSEAIRNSKKNFFSDEILASFGTPSGRLTAVALGGYLSHLVADMTTKKSIPLFGLN